MITLKGKEVSFSVLEDTAVSESQVINAAMNCGMKESFTKTFTLSAFNGSQIKAVYNWIHDKKILPTEANISFKNMEYVIGAIDIADYLCMLDFEKRCVNFLIKLLEDFIKQSSNNTSSNECAKIRSLLTRIIVKKICPSLQSILVDFVYEYPAAFLKPSSDLSLTNEEVDVLLCYLHSDDIFVESESKVMDIANNLVRTQTLSLSSTRKIVSSIRYTQLSNLYRSLYDSAFLKTSSVKESSCQRPRANRPYFVGLIRHKTTRYLSLQFIRMDNKSVTSANLSDENISCLLGNPDSECQNRYYLEPFRCEEFCNKFYIAQHDLMDNEIKVYIWDSDKKIPSLHLPKHNSGSSYLIPTWDIGIITHKADIFVFSAYKKRKTVIISVNRYEYISNSWLAYQTISLNEIEKKDSDWLLFTPQTRATPVSELYDCVSDTIEVYGLLDKNCLNPKETVFLKINIDLFGRNLSIKKLELPPFSISHTQLTAVDLMSKEKCSDQTTLPKPNHFLLPFGLCNRIPHMDNFFYDCGKERWYCSKSDREISHDLSESPSPYPPSPKRLKHLPYSHKNVLFDTRFLYSNGLTIVTKCPLRCSSKFTENETLLIIGRIRSQCPSLMEGFGIWSLNLPCKRQDISLNYSEIDKFVFEDYDLLSGTVILGNIFEFTEERLRQKISTLFQNNNSYFSSESEFYSYLNGDSD